VGAPPGGRRALDEPGDRNRRSPRTDKGRTLVGRAVTRARASSRASSNPEGLESRRRPGPGRTGGPGGGPARRSRPGATTRAGSGAPAPCAEAPGHAACRSHGTAVGRERPVLHTRQRCLRRWMACCGGVGLGTRVPVRLSHEGRRNLSRGPCVPWQPVAAGPATSLSRTSTTGRGRRPGQPLASGHRSSRVPPALVDVCAEGTDRGVGSAEEPGRRSRRSRIGSMAGRGCRLVPLPPSGRPARAATAPRCRPTPRPAQRSAACG
jgi:hypothetical protein